jgi:hypothetical protein
VHSLPIAVAEEANYKHGISSIEKMLQFDSQSQHQAFLHQSRLLESKWDLDEDHPVMLKRLEDTLILRESEKRAEIKRTMRDFTTSS